MTQLSMKHNFDLCNINMHFLHYYNNYCYYFQAIVVFDVCTETMYRLSEGMSSFEIVVRLIRLLIPVSSSKS